MSLAQQIELSCLMEATPRKPGNVHPAARFPDLCYDDFVQAARAIAEPLAAASVVGVGQAIDHAIRATREATGTNVNLGIVLLLAPLATVPKNIPLEHGISQILKGTTTVDAELVYSAIRIAQPGGMGNASAQDIRERPTVTLREAMLLAADHDRIAEQYVSEFELVFQARAKLCEILEQGVDWEEAIISLHVWMLSKWLDTLIVRKCGREVGEQARVRAEQLMTQSKGRSAIDPVQLKVFDDWLRADGHRRNPGTTADLIAAALFSGLRDGLITGPESEQILERAYRKDRYC